MKDRNNLLKRTEEIANVGSWDWDIETDTVTWSDQLFRIFQIDPKKGAVSYADHPKVYTPQSMKLLNDAVLRTINTGKPYDIEVDIIRGNNEIAHCIARGYATKNKEGKVIKLYGSFQDITSRKKSEKIIHNFFEQPMNLHIIASVDGTLKRVNKGFNTILGYKPKELIETSFFNLIHPDDLKNTQKEVEKLSLGKSILSFENRYKHKNGSWRILDWSALASTEDRLIYAVAKDITQQKQAEQKLRKLNKKLTAQNIEHANINEELRKANVELNIARESEKTSETKYKNLFNSIRDSIIIADHNRKIVHCNQAFTDLFGYSKNEIKGKETSSIYKDLKEFKEVGQKLKDHMNDPGFLVTISYKKRNGEIFPGETNAFYLRDEHGEIIGFIGLIRDISARVKAENELQETFKKLKDSESRFKALHNASFGGIFIHDKGLILECNQGLSNMTGYSREELIGMDSLLLINKRSREAVTNHILSEYEEPYEVTGLRKNGEEYPIRAEARMITCNDTRVRYVEFRDITEQKQYIHELELINHAAIGREERMIELKKEINNLHQKLELNPPYRTDIFDDHKI